VETERSVLAVSPRDVAADRGLDEVRPGSTVWIWAATIVGRRADVAALLVHTSDRLVVSRALAGRQSRIRLRPGSTRSDGADALARVREALVVALVHRADELRKHLRRVHLAAELFLGSGVARLTEHTWAEAVDLVLDVLHAVACFSAG